MTAGLDVAKNDPADIVGKAYDGVREVGSRLSPTISRCR